MKIHKYINLTYLFILIAGMFAFKYGLLETQPGYSSVLNFMNYSALVLACVFITAGGLFVNSTMAVGRVSAIPEEKAFNIYLILTAIGLALGFYISYSIGKPFYTGAFVVGAALFYIYATSLKQVLILGNIIAALIATMPFFIIISFDISPSVVFTDKILARRLFSVMLDYVYYTFIATFIISLLNDLANNDRDYNEGLNTLPIVAGRARAAKVVFFAALLLPALLFIYIDLYLTDFLYALAYLLLFAMGPLIYFALKLWNAVTEKDFKHLEKVLTWIMLFVVLSIIVITFNIRENVAG